MKDLCVTILGTGTCFPSLERSSAAVLVETGGKTLLLDSGPGTLRRLLEAGKTIDDITHLVYTHFHPDHTGDFVPFLFSTRYAPGRQREQHLSLVGGTGIREFYEKLKGVYGHWIEIPEALLTITEMDTAGRDHRVIDDVSVTTYPVSHNPESVGYRITSKGGKSLVYSGDTALCDSLVDLAAGADLFICESAFPEGEIPWGHLTPDMAGRIAAEAGVGHLVLTHFYPACETADIEGQCRRYFKGRLTLARDLMVFDLH
jgi:ribonuclease BN (tRNA processing enzyme)